jgi:hypothetical protein
MDGGLVLSPVSAEPCSKPPSTRLLTSLTSRPGVFAVGKATSPIAHLAHAATAATDVAPWVTTLPPRFIVRETDSHPLAGSLQKRSRTKKKKGPSWITKSLQRPATTLRQGCIELNQRPYWKACGAVQPDVKVCDFAASLWVLRPWHGETSS